MGLTTHNFDLKKLKYAVDWKLLLFLTLFLDVKLVVKIAAIVIAYLLTFDFRFQFSLKNSRLPLFYPLVVAIALISFIVNGDYTGHNYLVVFFTGLGFWLLCILAIHQIKLAVERNETEVLHQTIVVFFMVNAIVSLLNLASIVRETGALNPYTYQGDHQKYFIGTGDYIKGLTFDISTTNAVLNAFGVFYFLEKKNAAMLLTSMAMMLLTCSNFTNIVVLLILSVKFILKSSRDQKSLIALCVIFFTVFMARVSPQNNDYVVNSIENIFHKQHPADVPPAAVMPITIRPDSTLTAEEKRIKFATLYIDSVNGHKDKNVKPQNDISAKPIQTDAGRIIVPGPDINSDPYQSLTTTPSDQARLAEFVNIHKAALPISGQPFRWSPTPGKITSMQQTIIFLTGHPAKIFAGDGIGNFSSKLAFKASGLGIIGGYPLKYAYISPGFLKNHLDLYLDFFSRRAGFHSVINSSFSVYDQMLAEYGLAGLILFGIYYLGFFAKNYKTLTYGLPVLVLTVAILFIDYWFEQLSVLVFFELLLLLDIKESSAKLSPDHAR
jgi:hypothetical protein